MNQTHLPYPHPDLAIPYADLTRETDTAMCFGMDYVDKLGKPFAGNCVLRLTYANIPDIIDIVVSFLVGQLSIYTNKLK